MELELLGYFLPSTLLEYFTIVGFQEEDDLKLSRKILCIDLEEKNILPLGYDNNDYECKDFLPCKPIQDFPIRGKAVFLRIRRRRWRNKLNKNEVISNDYSFLSGGTKLTKDLSDFLKGTGRDPSRYD